MKKTRRKGYVAPIVITVLFLLYLALYFGVLVTLLPGGLGLIFLIVPVVIAGVLIYVCIERIKEIRSGVEDDLSKY